jgi:hypothetical protein
MARNTNPAPTPADPAVVELERYRLAFGDVPPETVERIAGVRAYTSPELRAILLAALAEPEELTPLLALRDYIDEAISRPQSVVIHGQTVSLGRWMAYEWWSEVGLNHGTVRGFWVKFCRKRNIAAWSLSEVLRLSAKQILWFDNVGPARLGELRTWLAGLGLHLRGDPEPEPGEAAVEPHPAPELCGA